MRSNNNIRNIGIIGILIVIFIITSGQPVNVEAQGLTEYSLLNLSIPLDYEPPSLNPVEIGYDRTSHLVVNQIFESFFRITPDGIIEPAGATDFDISEDGLIYTIHLRPNAVWSDGLPVVSQHYIDGMLALGSNELLADLLYPVQGFKEWTEGIITDPADVGITAIDDYTLDITLEAEAAYFPYLLASPWIKFAIRLDSGGVLLPYYNGPYVLYEWEPGEYIELVKNPSYWDAANVFFLGIYMPIMPDPAQQFAAYRNGALDVSGYPDDAVAEIQADPVLNAEH